MKRIRLKPSGVAGVAYDDWPVTQGIPFAEGELSAGTPVRVVDAKGKALPTQSAPLATWDPEGQSIRWLLLDFQLDRSTGDMPELFLEYGDGAVAPEHETPVTVERDRTHLTVNTGPMELEFARGQPDFLAACRVRTANGWHEVLDGTPGMAIYMCDQHGNEYGNQWPGWGPEVHVEEEGPLRSVIYVHGWHMDSMGRRFCPYILRLHAFAGKAELRVFHTFIFDQDPNAIELTGVGVNLSIGLGERVGASVGGDRKAHHASGKGEIYFRQKDDEHYEARLDDESVGSGTRTRGWACVNGTAGGALAVVRNCWQEYPKGFRISEAGLDIQIWPKWSEPLAFTTPFEHGTALQFGKTRDEKEVKRILNENPTAPINLKSFGVQTSEDLEFVERMLEKYAPDRSASHNDTGTDNGVGAAKTTEVHLRFSPELIGEEAAESFARTVQDPPIAPADPAYACATGAMGGMFCHAGDPAFAEIDDGLDFLVESVIVEPMEKCRLYGMMRYGNMVCSHSPGPAVAYIYWKDKDPERALRHVGPYNNEANDQVMAVWGNFLRTGRRDHYSLAQNYSRTIADVTICHAHPRRPGDVGLMHYHNAHQWSGNKSPSHTLVAGILMDYYTSGNRRLLEVAREVADWAVRRQTPCGLISNRTGVLHREFTGPLWCLMEVYRATWERQYGDVAERSLNWLLRTLPEPGKYHQDIFTRGSMGDEAVVAGKIIEQEFQSARDIYHILESALRLFDSSVLRRHILATADDITWKRPTDNFVTRDMAKSFSERSHFWEVEDGWYWTEWCVSGNSWSMPILCLAYELTGDPVYPAFAKDHLFGYFRRQIKRCRQFADWRFTWLTFGAYVPRLMQLVAKATERDPEGLARAEEEWLRRRRELGVPVYRGDGVDLAKDTMSPNGQIENRPPVEIPRDYVPPPGHDQTKSLGRLSTTPHPKP